MLSYTDEQITERGVALGLVEPGEPVPNHLRSKVVADLLADDRAQQQPPAGTPRLARSIVVQAGGDLLIDGEPLPYLIARDSIEVVCNPKGDGTVRLTLLAEQVQITAPKNDQTESENRA